MPCQQHWDQVHAIRHWSGSISETFGAADNVLCWFEPTWQPPYHFQFKWDDMCADPITWPPQLHAWAESLAQGHSQLNLDLPPTR
jgi:hypothetical protein